MTLACAPEVLAEGHLHPCWGWIFDAQLGTADYVPAAPALFVGSLGAGFKMRWFLLVQSLLGWSWVGDALWWRNAVQGGLGCSSRADIPLCARVC